MKNRVVLSSKVHDHGTPLKFYKLLDSVFHFNCDPVADAKNRLGAKLFYTAKDNGLLKPWGTKSFVNPPFNLTKEFVIKAIQEHNDLNLVVMLIASRTGNKTWQDYIFKNARVICFYRGRFTFDKAKEVAPFDSAIVIFTQIGLTVEQQELIESLGHTFVLS